MLTGDELQRVLRIVARASTPSERRSARFRLLPTPETALDARLDAFVTAVANGDEKRLEKLLAARGLTLSLFRRSLSDVEAGDPARLPPWGAALLEIVDGAFGENEPDPMFERCGAWAPFVALGARRIDRALATTTLPVAARARKRMYGLLAGRVLAVTAFVPAGRSAISDRAACLETFEEYPVLARLIATALSHACRSIEELLVRLARDLNGLSTRFASGEPLERLEDFEVGTEESHARGRAVAILTFTGGRRVVYKPRDLRIAHWFFRVVDRLNGLGLPDPLHVRSIWTRGDYAWEEFVATRSCRTEDEVQAYFRRMGMLLRLFELLGGHDFHQENLVASGAQPAPVDLEILLLPRHAPPDDVTEAERRARERVDESALPVGILPFFVASEAGRRGIDLSALARPGTFAAPYALPGEAGAVQVYQDLAAGRAAPRLAGVPVNPAAHFDSVEEGYAAMDACLRQHKHVVFDSELLGQLRELPVRVLHRATQIYHRLLTASFAPHFLRDGVTWDACLQRLWQAHFPNPHHPVEIYESEVQALRALDVPLFYSQPGSCCLVLNDGTELAGFFDECAADHLERRLGAEADGSVEIVRTALSTHVDGWELPLPADAFRSRAPHPSSWLEPAVAVADFILAQSVVDDQGGRAWLGLSYQPWSDHYGLDLLGDSLLSGTGGLAILFAELGRATGLQRFREASLACAASLTRSVPFVVEDLAVARDKTLGRLDPTPCGLHWGIGASLFALARTARLLDAPPLLAPVANLRRALESHIMSHRVPSDLVSGLAGLVFALLEDPAAHDLAAALAARLPAMADEPAPYPPDAGRLDGLPGTGAGIALARLQFGEAPFDFQEPATAGDLLGQLAALRSFPDRTTEVVARVERFLEEGELTSTGQLLDRIELATTAHRVTSRADLLDHAEASARILLGVHERFGTWFPDLRACDAHLLSVIFGIGAVSYACLRLDRPDDVGSLRVPLPD